MSCPFFHPLYAPINVKPAGGRGGEVGHRARFWSVALGRGRVFELSCCPGGRYIWIFVHARDHKSFPGWGISVIFDLTFLAGGREFDSDFLENVKMPPYAPPPHPCTCIKINYVTLYVYSCMYVHLTMYVLWPITPFLLLYYYNVQHTYSTNW